MEDLERTGNVSLSTIITKLVTYDSELRGAVSCCKSLAEVIQKLVSPEYSTFWDYDLIKILIDYGSEEIKSNFIEYKKKLQKFFEERLIEQPFGGFAVIVDKSIIDECNQLDQLQNRIRIILGHPSLTLVVQESLSAQPKSPLRKEVETTLQDDALASDSTPGNGSVTLSDGLCKTSQSRTSFFHCDETSSSGISKLNLSCLDTCYDILFYRS